MGIFLPLVCHSFGIRFLHQKEEKQDYSHDRRLCRLFLQAKTALVARTSI